jgi:putative Mn2+ efflux pump MntP
MYDVDFWLVIRCLLFLIVICGLWLGLYLVYSAYKKTLEKAAYLVGIIFISVSAFILLALTTDIFH